jgi:DNA-binding transcriptional regulator/RsmH inhibitor MraZ
MAKVSPLTVGDLFFGEFEKCTISDRVTIPLDLREPLSLQEGKSCVVARITSASFAVISKAIWNDQVNEVLKSGIKDERLAVNLNTHLGYTFAACYESEVDGRGRVPLPKRIKDEFDTVKHVTIVAIGNCAEVWKPEKWEDCLSKTESSLWKIFDVSRSPKAGSNP